MREAQFFYQHLLAHRDNPLGWKQLDDPNAFEFYLSAFIQAARSVAWVLQSEEKERYDAWRPEWEEQLTPPDRKLIKLTNEQRLDTVKREGIKTIAEWQDFDLYEMLEDTPIQAKIFDANIGTFPQPGRIDPPTVKLKRRVLYTPDADKVELTEVCKRYLDFLERLIREFLQAQGQSAG